MKRIVTLLLALIMVISLAACGSTSSAPASNAAPAASEAAPAEAAEPSSSAEAEELETFKIGTNQDLSGSISVMGRGLVNGMQLAVDNINAAGGIDGRKVELAAVYDVKTDVNEAITATQRLVTVDKVHAIINSQVSNIGLAMTSISEELGVPQISVWGDPRIEVNEDGTLNKWLFAFQPTAPQVSVIECDYMLAEMGIKKYGVLALQDNAYAMSMVDGITGWVEEHAADGAEIVDIQYYKSTDTDVKTQCAKLVESTRNGGAEALFVTGNTSSAAVAMTQLYQAGCDVPVTGTSDFQPNWGELVEPEVANNIYLFDNVNSSSDTCKSFVEQYKETYGEAPVTKAFLGYDMVYVLCEAVRQAGSLEPEAIRSALENDIHDMSLLVGNFSINADTHYPDTSVWMFKLENGKYVPIKQW